MIAKVDRKGWRMLHTTSVVLIEEAYR